MVKYGKLIDGSLRLAPKRVNYKGKQIINPRAEVLIELGYKPIKYTDMPEETEGYYWVSKWQETENEIIQIWEKEIISESEE